MSRMIIERLTDLAVDAVDRPGHYSAFLGVSLGHRFFSKENIKFYCEWSRGLFRELVILLMDDPDRHNLSVFKMLGEEEALAKVSVVSDEVKRSYERAAKAAGATHVRVVQFRDFAGDPDYARALGGVRGSMAADPELVGDLNGMMDGGIGGKIREFSDARRLTEQDHAAMKQVLMRYIVEEFASLLYFTEKGFPIELDPHVEFSTKRRLYDGEFRDLHQRLRLTRRGHIFVFPEGTSYHGSRKLSQLPTADGPAGVSQRDAA